MSAAPPYWQIDIQKKLGTEYWTNVYHVARSNQAAAAAAADFWVGIERSIHSEDVQFVSYRVAPFPGPSEGTIYPIGLFGSRPTADSLPLFNVLRVDFPAPTGRPSRKYYRLPVREGDQANGSFTSAAMTDFINQFVATFEDPDSAGLIDVDGQLLTSATPMITVGMRQLRRGSKRRLQPVIPVG